MTVHVDELRDPGEADAAARDFLTAQPTHHNLALSILATSCELGLAGRFWIARDNGAVVGYAGQSPPGMRVVLARVDTDVAGALADVIDDVPGVQGDAAGAAAFTGRYALRNHARVTDTDPGRLYELTRVEPVAAPAGRLRPATAGDHELVTEWLVAFGDATDDPAAPARASEEVAFRIARGEFWLWDDDRPTCVVGVRAPVAGVARVGPVYTPPERRGRGYATAGVADASRALVDQGLRCVLYTQLSNPTSNAIYHRMGYRPIAEIVSYGFG